MKEMKYQFDRKIEVLDTGYCFELLYYILNLGTHPTAYIKIPRTHPYYNKNYEEIDLDVHGGLTYSEDHLYIAENQKVEGYFIGWDYAHYGDYLGFEEKYIKGCATGKKWTTEEIRKEVYYACYKIKMAERKV